MQGSGSTQFFDCLSEMLPRPEATMMVSSSPMSTHCAAPPPTPATARDSAQRVEEWQLPTNPFAALANDNRQQEPHQPASLGKKKGRRQLSVAASLPPPLDETTSTLPATTTQKTDGETAVALTADGDSRLIDATVGEGDASSSSGGDDDDDAAGEGTQIVSAFELADRFARMSAEVLQFASNIFDMDVVQQRPSVRLKSVSTVATPPPQSRLADDAGSDVGAPTGMGRAAPGTPTPARDDITPRAASLQLVDSASQTLLVPRAHVSHRGRCRSSPVPREGGGTPGSATKRRRSPSALVHQLVEDCAPLRDMLIAEHGSPTIISDDAGPLERARLRHRPAVDYTLWERILAEETRKPLHASGKKSGGRRTVHHAVKESLLTAVSSPSHRVVALRLPTATPKSRKSAKKMTDGSTARKRHR